MGDAAAGKRSFKVDAHLLVPRNVDTETLRSKLEALANEMTLDIGLGERPRPPA
jgi:glycine cleavage system regulatory protein